MSGGLLSRADKFPWSLNCYLEFLSRGLRHDYSIWQLVQNLSLRQRMFIRFLVPVWRLYYTVPNWDGVSSQSEPLIRWSDLQSDREKHGVRKPLRGNPDYTPFNQFRSRAQRTSGIIAERMTEKFGRSASYNVQFLRGGGGTRPQLYWTENHNYRVTVPPVDSWYFIDRTFVSRKHINSSTWWLAVEWVWPSLIKKQNINAAVASLSTTWGRAR